MKTWYCIEVRRPGRMAEYLGKMKTTMEAIEEEARQSGWLFTVTGNCVTIYGLRS
jgi:hypothetical protein